MQGKLMAYVLRLYLEPRKQFAKNLAGKILYRVDRGIYRFNPYLFGRGDWQDVARLRLEIKYDEIQGRTFQTNVDYTEQKQPAADERPADTTQQEEPTTATA